MAITFIHNQSVIGKENNLGSQKQSSSGTRDKRQPPRSSRVFYGSSRSRPSTAYHAQDPEHTKSVRGGAFFSAIQGPNPSRPLLQSFSLERALTPGVRVPLEAQAESELVISSAPPPGFHPRQIVWLLASVPALIKVHGQIAYGDNSYAPFEDGYRFNHRRVALRPGLHPQPPPGEGDGWTQVGKGRRIKGGPVPDHSSEDVAVLDRCQGVEQSKNPKYRTGRRPALVMAAADATLTVALITSFSGLGLANADRFTKLVSYPVSGTAEPHECFDYDRNGNVVSITNQPLSLGANWKYFKEEGEAEQFILAGSPFVVDETAVVTEKYYEVDEGSFEIILAETERQTSPALAGQMNLRPSRKSIATS